MVYWTSAAAPGLLVPIPFMYTHTDFTKKPRLFSGGGGLVCTARDYMHFATMLLNGGEFNGKGGREGGSEGGREKGKEGGQALADVCFTTPFSIIVSKPTQNHSLLPFSFLPSLPPSLPPSSSGQRILKMESVMEMWTSQLPPSLMPFKVCFRPF